MLRGTRDVGRRAIGIGLIVAAGVVTLRADQVSLQKYQARIADASKESRARYTDWLGPSPRAGVPIANLDLPWLSAPATMDVESAVAYEVAREWFGQPDARTTAIVNGAAWYLQSRVVERLFDFTFFTDGCCMDSTAFFGGTMPWTFARLPLGRWSAGLGRALPAGRRLPSSVDAPAIRAALAFGTLERYFTWPALQSALREWARLSAMRTLTREDIERTLAMAAGQDLAWFFPTAFDPARCYDYALEKLTSTPATCDNQPCYRTRVTAVRRGDAVFTGSSRAPDGPYPSGDALELRVGFADGTPVVVRWDGRQGSRVFEFESAVPAVDAYLDPAQTLLLDDNYLDNRLAATASSNISVGKWVSRWVVWLENAMLTYGALL